MAGWGAQLCWQDTAARVGCVSGRFLACVAWLLVALTLDKVGYTVAAKAQDQVTIVACTVENAENCVMRCEAALYGFNGLFRQPNIDLPQLKQRALQVDACRLAVQNRQVDAVGLRLLENLFSSHESDFATATTCATAIRNTSGMQPGPGEYLREFERMNCARYARAEIEQIEQQKICELQKDDFQKAFASNNLRELNDANNRFECKEYRAKIYLRIVELKKAGQAPLAAAEPGAVQEDSRVESAADARMRGCAQRSRSWQYADVDEFPAYSDVESQCAGAPAADPDVAAMLQQVRGCTEGLARMRLEQDIAADSLQEIARNCPKLETLVALRLTERERAATAEGGPATLSTCLKETRIAEALVSRGTYGELTMHIRAANCSSLNAQRSQMVEALCNSQAIRLSNHLFTSGDTASSLKALYDCPSLATAIDRRFAELFAARRSAEVCQTESLLLAERRSSYTGLKMLAGSLDCAKLRPAVTAALAEFCTREGIEFGRFAIVGNGTMAEYEAARASVECPDTRDMIATAIRSMQTHEACGRETIELGAIPVDNLTAINAFESRRSCSSLAGEVSRRIEQAEAILACAREQKILSQIDSTNIEALQALRAEARCRQIGKDIDVRLVEARQKLQCETEHQQFQALQGSSDVDRLRRFLMTLKCGDLIWTVRARISELESLQIASAGPSSPAVGIDAGGDARSGEQVAAIPGRSRAAQEREAGIAVTLALPDAPRVTEQADEPQLSGRGLAEALQRELHRLGCYTGGIDGDFGSGSRSALQRYNRTYKKPAERELDLALLSELKSQGKTADCAPAARPQVVVDKQPKQAPNKNSSSGKSNSGGAIPRPAPAAPPGPAAPRNLGLGGIGF